MKRFLKQILYFTLTVVGLAFLFSGLNLYLIRKNILNPENFRLPDSTTILIAGDSYVHLSLNPKYIRGAANETIVAEHYLYSYTRIKRFIEVNPNLKYVVLSFNYSTIAHTFDEGLFDVRTQSFFFAKEFMLLDREELNVVSANNMVFIRNFMAWKLGVPSRENLSLIKKTLSKDFKPKQLPFRGGFLECGSGGSVDDYQLRLRITECFRPDASPALSPMILKYMDKIRELCESNGVKLVLYASPLHHRFFDAIPDFYKNAYQSECAKLPPSVIYLDYSRYSLPDSCFFDISHLNGTGAKIISSRFLNDLYSH
jgi:hypothetical protein